MLALILAGLVPPPPPAMNHAINPQTVRVENRYICGGEERVLRWERRNDGGAFVLTAATWAGKPLPRGQIAAANRELDRIAVGNIHPQCGEGYDELVAYGSKDGARAAMVLRMTPERIVGSDVMRMGP